MIRIIITIFLLGMVSGGVCSAQKQQVKIRSYTIETTYEKLKTDYPFIKPIEKLETGGFDKNENITYHTTADRSLKADVYFPKDTSVKKPAVLLVFGGGWISGSKENVRPMAQHFADNGFVAVTAEYRLSREAKYPAAVLDLKAAVRWMRQNAETYGINSEQIAILGNSAGAQLATLVGVTGDSKIYNPADFKISDAVQAIINVDGIVSFTHSESEEGQLAGKWLNGLESENPKNWKEASPLEYVDANTPPTLFINSTMPRFHAGRDDMLSILDQNNIYNEVHTIPGTPHSFWLMQPWFDKTLQYSMGFLNKVFQSESSKVYREITVAKDDSGDFKSIQEAINSTRDLGPDYVKVYIKNGIYNEKIEVPAWKRKIALGGESRDGVVIVNNDYSGKVDSLTGFIHSTFTSYTLKVEGRDFYAENLTIQNTSCDQGQAVALHTAGDRSIFKNCKILGCQDTVYTAGENNRVLFDNCHIEGTTDFIFGQATAFFDDCEIKSFNNSYVTAASTPAKQKYGYVFLNCKLTAAEGVTKVYLGRPWRPYAKTIFINTQMGNHIRPEGWNVWDGDKMFPHKERTVFYAEYNSKGAGANSQKRMWWSHQLYEEDIEYYTRAHVLAGHDKWKPEFTLSILNE